MYPETCNPTKNHQEYRYGRYLLEDVFRCRQCNALVTTQTLLSGVKNRNHCPYCLWSRHVDLLQAGDRLSACKASMEPIGLTVKQRQNKYGSGNSGELMLIHRCNVCNKFSINRIAADDFSDKLLEIFYASDEMDSIMRGNLDACGIRLLLSADYQVVNHQLYGALQN
jgi:hypothetical protein